MCLAVVVGGIAFGDRAVAASPGDGSAPATPRSYVIATYDGAVQVHRLNPIAGTGGEGQVYSNTSRAIGVFDPAQDILGQTLTVYVPGAFGGENWVADPVDLVETTYASSPPSCVGTSAEVLFAGGGTTFDATVCVSDAAALSNACVVGGGDITASAVACGTAFGLDGNAVHLVSIPVNATLLQPLAVYAHVSTDDAGVVLGGDVEIGFSIDGATVGSSGPACVEGVDISGGDAGVSSNLWASLFCEPEMTIRLEAVKADGVECAKPTDPSELGICEWHKEGRELVLRFRDQIVQVEGFLSDFGGGDFCTVTGEACDNSITIFDRTCSDNGEPCFTDSDCKVCSDDNQPCANGTDCAGFPVVSCNETLATCDDDCSSKFCEDATTPCLLDDDCAGIGDGRCGINNDCGRSVLLWELHPDCATHASGKAGALLPYSLGCGPSFDFCTGVDRFRPDYYFQPCIANGVPGTFDGNGFANCPDGLPGQDAVGAVNGDDCLPGDSGVEVYGGQFAAAVTDDAVGRFYMALDLDPIGTFAVMPESLSFYPIEAIPAVVEVQTGSCCFGQPNIQCVDDQTFADCDALNGIYTVNGACPTDGAQQCAEGVPAVSSWGMVVLVLLLLTAGKVAGRRAGAAAV